MCSFLYVAKNKYINCKQTLKDTQILEFSISKVNIQGTL